MSVTRFAHTTINFPATKGHAQTGTNHVIFPQDVVATEAAIRGYKIGFVESDHHLGRLELNITSVSFYKGRVDVTATLLLRDYSGNIDDLYEGSVDVLVIAETAS